MVLETTHATPATERILLIDDDRFSLQVMRMALEKAGMVVEAESNPIKAVEILKSNPREHFTCVISDYQMPEMDGIEVLKQSRDFDSCLGAVMITAIDEQEVVKESYRSGALDFLTKPVNPRDLVKIARDTTQLTLRARKETETVAGVEEAGREGNGIQSPLPESLKKRLSIFYRPRHAIGGDFIIGYEKNDQQLALLLGDVSGHTMKSALLSSYFQGFMQGQTQSDSAFLPALAKFNDLLFDNNEQTSGNRSSLSLCHFEINREGSQVDMINCGFSAPIVVNEDGIVNEWQEGTFAVGWFDGIDLSSEQKDTDKACFLYSATDGLADHAADLGLNTWGLYHFLQNNQDDHELMERILGNCRDDILAARFNLRDQENQSIEKLPQVVYFATYPGTAIMDIDGLQKTFVESLALALGKHFESRKHDILICVREGMINALKYGCQKSGNLLAHLTATFVVETCTLTVTISDPGTGHDFDIDERRADLKSHLPADKHLGLVMMHELPDAISTQGNGAHVSMKFILKDSNAKNFTQFMPTALLSGIDNTGQTS